HSTESSLVESQRKPSFNGELNGVLGADLIGAGGLATMVEPTAHNSDKLNGQDTQTICLSGDDGSTCVPIRANNVEIVSSRDSSIDSKARGSNKVKIQPVAKYDWEHKYYYGNLIAVSNSYLAYAIRGANNHSMIRVLRLGSTERLLLKGFTGAVTDLAFAHLDSNLLGCVDEAGNMFIWQLTSHSSKIQDEVIVHIRRPEDTPLNSNRRLIWCPFIPEDNDENPEDACQTLALLHEDRAEVWDLDILRSNNSSWPVDATDLKEGFITIRGHTRISEGALSPDGTVLATASHDGFVKFWQIYIEGQDQPRFSPDPFNSSVLPSLKASLDLSAEFLILSDVQRKVLYVMELLQDQEKGCASFTAISEFLLTHPVLSFGIQDVARARLRHTEVLPPDEESESMTTENGILVDLKMLNCLNDIKCLSLLGFSDPLADLNVEAMSSDKESGDSGSQNDLSKILALPTPADFMSPAPSALPKLMTPDAFMMPSTSIPASPGSSASSLTIVTAMSSSDSGAFTPPLVLSPSLLREAFLLCEAAPYSHRLPLQYFLSPPPQVSPPNPPLSLDLQVLDPMVVPLASPTRARSPDVISSASTAMSQDIPEIASETLQRGLAGAAADSGPVLHSDSMASAASVLHLLSPRARSSAEHSLLSLELGAASVDGEQRHNNTPSLLETALSQENAVAAGGSCSDSSVNHTWPAAPDITRETRNSLRDNGLGDWRTYHLTQNDSQDASAEQSDHDDEVASLASSGNCGPRSSHRLPVKDWKTSPRSSPKLKRKSKKDEGESSQSRQIENQVKVQDELLQMLRSQQREIAELRQNQLDLLQRVTSHMDAVQSSIMAHIEHAMLAQQEQERILPLGGDLRMERILVEGQSRNQQLQDQLVQQLVQTLNNSLSNRLDKVLREEMKKTVPQAISKSLEPVTGQMSSTIAAKLTAVEGTLKENVTKVVKSKNTTDAIGRAAAEAMQGPIQSAYKETFQSIVLPVFERGCQSMFQQINDSFKQGTNEYIQQLETHIKNRKQRDQEARDPVIGQLQQMIDTLQNSQDQLATTVTTSVCSDVQRQLHMIVGNLQDSILTQVQRIVKGEVSLAMKEQQAAVTSSIMQAMRSAAGTPVPSAHLDYQAQQASILQLLQQGQLNEAFQQALSAADLNLVLYVCETIDSQQVFGQQTCPLHQAVLLSLIQQLSTNLSTRTELKISYLEDAVMNLDHGDPVTRDHMSAVLSQVRQKLLHFLQQDAHSPLCKRARRLMMMLPCSAAATKKCSSIYKGFAQCLLALGDTCICCRSWDDFHDCANVAMAGCPEEAAVVWESLRQESKKMQFSGNLYEMCSSRSQSAAASDSQSPDETNQESLKGCASHTSLTFLTFCLSVLLLFPWI
uniref:Enhancer of mRNA-decapping protein 4 n=1 Tax=Cyprinus carpio TaxID=7962 RepID=A0A8C2A278_CYPCA